MTLLIILLFVICFSVGIYSLLAALFHLPRWNDTVYRKKQGKKKKPNFKIFENTATSIAKILPLSSIKEAKLKKQIKAANLDITPKEYMAQLWLYTGILIAITVVVACFQPILAIVPGIVTVFVYIKKKDELRIRSKERIEEIEKALPRFVSYTTNRLRTEHNIINIIDDFNAEESGPLAEELKITVADMRTGNQERAIERFQERINSPVITELCRGILSAMRGEDVAAYFENLNRRLITLWGQRLRLELLKKEPKITRMSMMIVGCSLISTVIVLLVFVVQALASMGV